MNKKTRILKELNELADSIRDSSKEENVEARDVWIIVKKKMHDIDEDVYDTYPTTSFSIDYSPNKFIKNFFKDQ